MDKVEQLENEIGDAWEGQDGSDWCYGTEGTHEALADYFERVAHKLEGVARKAIKIIKEASHCAT